MVTRWDINECASAGVEHSEFGDYVEFDDYETLASQYDDLQEKYDSLVKKLGELYQEG